METINGVTLQDVDSSMISHVGYDAAHECLYVKFHGSGKSGSATWLYDGVTPMEYTRLTAAPSIGKHFIQNIRGVKTSQRIS
jgi:hypothetical protein